MKLTSQQLDTVCRSSLFRTVPPSLVQRIAASPECEIKNYDKGSLVYGRTEFSRSLGIVLCGNLRVSKGSADGHAIIMSTLTPAAVFGAAALFNDNAEYATDIHALCQAQVIFFSQRLFERMLATTPQIAENYIRYLSERILFLNKKIYLLSAGTAEQRLASFIADNLPTGEECELPMPVNKLAAALNISRASLYRAFDALTESGAIVKNGRKICVTNAERLKNI